MRGTALVLCVFALSSCGRVGNMFGGGDEPAQTTQTAASANTSTASTQPIIVPPGAGDRPLLPGQSPRAQTPDGLPALQPARGVNVESLFADDIRDPIDRVKRVENAVIDLRRDFNAVMPAIVRLSAVEEDMQTLLSQLESLLENEPPSTGTYNNAAAPRMGDIPAAQTATAPPTSVAPPPQQPAPVAAPPPTTPPPAVTPPPAPTQPRTSGSPAVQELRVGEHGGKTRLVFDVNGPLAYNYDLDNNENLLVIEMPGVAWDDAMQQNFGNSPRVASYSVQPMDGGGSRVIIALKRAASVAYETTIKPNANSANYRAVIDLTG